jgi:endonuclease/exonuclease/phosphatase family metal-dependent hydrolase
MKILTWNMDHWRRSAPARDAAWDFVLESGASIALLQEALPPTAVVESGRVAFGAGGRAWGSAVYVADGLPFTQLPIEASHPGAVVAVELEMPKATGPLTVVSIYGLLESILGTEYSTPSLHRTLSDLTALLDDPARRGRIVLGGDFNLSLEWDRKGGRVTSRVLFDRIEDFGLESCFPYRDGFQPTWRHRSGSLGQLDYLFVSRELTDRVSASPVVEVADLSDHWPLAVELEVAD